MVFSSIVFLFYFLAPVLTVYFVVPKKWRNAVLFIASLIFYAWGEPKYVLLMLFSAIFNYASGLVIDRARHRRLALAGNVAVNIGILVFFKYTGFICSWFGVQGPGLALPIGISFYTFQALSYTIDVYRKKTPVQKKFLHFGLYLALFPQLIAGPIVRYDDVAKQLESRRITGEKFMKGFTRFCAGLCKKVIIANAMGKLWTLASAGDAGSLTMAMAWLGIFAYSMQIYFDFSGYSDMAIGLGKMFGFDFLENFNYPYISRSATEFWRRWHISLGSWFREYVYIPLGGNRNGRVRTNLNLMAVWMLTGLWHGASWNFVMWGAYFGVLLILEKSFLLKLLEKNSLIGFIYSSLAVAVGWVMFATEDFSQMISYLSAMVRFSDIGLTDPVFLYELRSYAVLFAAAIIAACGAGRIAYNAVLTPKLERVKYIFAAAGFIICTIYLVDDSYNPFLYFRF